MFLKKIFDGVDVSISYATLKRTLKSNNYLSTKGKGTKYLLSPTFELIQPIDIQQYYQKEVDERRIKENFNFDIITDVLVFINIFRKMIIFNLCK